MGRTAAALVVEDAITTLTDLVNLAREVATQVPEPHSLSYRELLLSLRTAELSVRRLAAERAYRP